MMVNSPNKCYPEAWHYQGGAFFYENEFKDRRFLYGKTKA